MIGFKSINTRISIIFIVVITLLILTSNIVLYLKFSNIILDRMLDDQKSIMLQNKANIENLANGINRATVYLYTDKAVADILNKQTNDSLDMITDKAVLNDQFRNYSNAPISSSLNTYYAVLFIYDRFSISKELEPISIGENTDSMNGVFSTSKVHNQKWFKETEKCNGALYTFNLGYDKKRVYVARLIRNKYINDPKYNDSIGIVVIGIDAKHFKNHIEASKLTEKSQVFLINADKKVIYSNNEEALWKDISKYDLTSQIKTYNFGQAFIVQNKGRKYMTTVYSLHWGWRLISMIPYDDITKGLDIVKRIIIFTTILGVFAGWGLTILISKSISKPIIKLASIMHDVRDESNIDICIKSRYRDEVGMLYKSFNSMMKRINKLVADVYESSSKQKNAELKVLQAQINPHFIYNTLDAINWMALCKNEDDIVTMVSSLAYIMRYSIKNPDDKVKLEEEVMHVEKYVSIQAIRYDNMFDVEYEIDPCILEYKVPKFIIQPLVENAVIHGLKKVKRRGKIRISGKHTENSIEISVKDNGEGADIQELNNYLDGKITSLVDSDGFGIKNVDQRIKLNYGENYGLSYRSNMEDGITAVIIIPANEQIYNPKL